MTLTRSIRSVSFTASLAEPMGSAVFIPNLSSDGSCGRGRVQRLMRIAGLQGVHHRKWRRGGEGRLPAVFEDRVRRVFTADAPDSLWVMDITQYRTLEGWV